MALVISGAVVEPLGDRDPAAPARLVDLRIVDGRIERIEPRIETAPGDEVVAANGGGVLPGLHDHHVHLRAWAAQLSSVSVDPSDVTDAAALGERLRSAPGDPGTWVRATGYHESIAGLLDRVALDRLVPDQPARVQHRSGALWMLDTRALELLQIDGLGAPGEDADEVVPGTPPDGLERDGAGRPTGRLWRADGWLHRRRLALAPEPPPDLGPIGRRAAAAGVTGFTDATPDLDAEGLGFVLDARERGALPQRLHLMGDPAILSPVIGARRSGAALPEVTVGPLKRLLDDDRLPPLGALVDWIGDAHRRHMAVALHCVTRTQAALAVAAWREADAAPGDRMEHGAVLGPDLLPALAALGITVVTQPGFLLARGDRYLADVLADEHPDLWRLRSLIEAGIEVGMSSDAPLGPDDPWTIARTAGRRTAGGRFGDHAERGDPTATRPLPLLRGRRSARSAPEGPAGAVADLVVLATRLDEAIDAGAAAVRATIVGGRIVHRSDGGLTSTG